MLHRSEPQQAASSLRSLSAEEQQTAQDALSRVESSALRIQPARIRQAGTHHEVERILFHAFRHFNVSLMDALRVPLRTIQERIGHAVTGVFTLDVYREKQDFQKNMQSSIDLEAEIERAVKTAKFTAKPLF